MGNSDVRPLFLVSKLPLGLRLTLEWSIDLKSITVPVLGTGKDPTVELMYPRLPTRPKFYEKRVPRVCLDDI